MVTKFFDKIEAIFMKRPWLLLIAAILAVLNTFLSANNPACNWLYIIPAIVIVPVIIFYLYLMVTAFLINPIMWLVKKIKK